MGSFRRDPYLWIHLAGLAALPLFLDICLLGLAAGYPVMPVWLEMGLLLGFGIVPVLWMQWQRPFYIFSLLAVAVKPEQLTEERRRLLPLFRSWQVKLFTGLGAIVWAWILWQIYCLAPIAAAVTPFKSHLLGLGVAALAFLGSNLFLQVPLSVLRVLLANEQQLAAIEPYAAAAIAQDFTILGLRLKQVLPELEDGPSAVGAADVSSIEGADTAEIAESEPVPAVPNAELPEVELSEAEAKLVEADAAETDKTEQDETESAALAEDAEAAIAATDSEEAESEADASAAKVVLSPSESQAEEETVTVSEADANEIAELEAETAAVAETDVTEAADSAAERPEVSLEEESPVVLSPSEGQAEVETITAETEAEAIAQEDIDATDSEAPADEEPIVLSPSEGQAAVETIPTEADTTAVASPAAAEESLPEENTAADSTKEEDSEA
ncbi:low-complexity tail membrane protein [Sphaerothrix gracilis]|uniref:low-complexity tail membrane protein n=1 Tax=Sphaerothrix gracilis TaxID=3151835 RepID=UPI0031FD6C85